MKIKLDFITNSSSSTFIVAWPYKIKTIDDVLQFIYGENIHSKAETVFIDAKKQKGLIIEENKKILKIITKELFSESRLNFTLFRRNFLERNGIQESDLRDNHQWFLLMFDEYDKLNNIESAKGALSFIQKNKGKYLYIFSYADDTNLGSELEHGGTFNNLEHIQISPR